jgi:hypothetical protein
LSKPDCYKALFTGLPNKPERLYLIQNSSARLLKKMKRRKHITPVLTALHWLPVSFIIDFKVLRLMFKALNGLWPFYLSDWLTTIRPQEHSGSLLLANWRIPLKINVMLHLLIRPLNGGKGNLKKSGKQPQSMSLSTS